MAAELIIANLRGGTAEREAAYTELLRREEEHNANADAAPAATAATRAEELQALKLSELRARALMAGADQGTAHGQAADDEELFALEDLVADYVDLTMLVADRIITRDMIYAMPGVDGVASKLDKLVGLSAAMAGDAAFARQARRKFL